MKRAIFKRLGQLEDRRAAALSAAFRAAQSRDAGERIREWFRTAFRLFHTEKGAHESYMDALARCVGLMTWELRGLLRQPDEFNRVV